MLKKIKKENINDQNTMALQNKINNVENMIKFYKTQEHEADLLKYWEDYLAYINKFIANNYVVTQVPKDSKFSDSPGIRAAATWLRDTFKIDLSPNDEYIINVESKKIKESKVKPHLVYDTFMNFSSKGMKPSKAAMLTVNKLKVDIYDVADAVADEYDLDDLLESKNENRILEEIKLQKEKVVLDIDRLWNRLPESFKNFINRKFNVNRLTYSKLRNIVDTFGSNFGYEESKKENRVLENIKQIKEKHHIYDAYVFTTPSDKYITIKNISNFNRLPKELQVEIKLSKTIGILVRGDDNYFEIAGFDSKKDMIWEGVADSTGGDNFELLEYGSDKYQWKKGGKLEIEEKKNRVLENIKQIKEDLLSKFGYLKVDGTYLNENGDKCKIIAISHEYPDVEEYDSTEDGKYFWKKYGIKKDFVFVAYRDSRDGDFYVARTYINSKIIGESKKEDI